MSCTHIGMTAGLAILLFTAPAVFAGDSPEENRLRAGVGNPEEGRVKSLTCQGCHGIDGNSFTADFPKLAGQYATYIQKQIDNFKAGLRTGHDMSSIVTTVTNIQDALDISAYFASQPQMRAEASMFSEAGRSRFMQPGNGCVNCHGINGKGLAPGASIAPVIGGQHKDYLIKQLRDFRSGARRGDSSRMMAAIAGPMSDEEIEDVANYISGL